MAYQVHRIVQESEGVDDGRLLRPADPIQHEMPAFPSPARHVQRHQPFSDFIAFPRSGNIGPAGSDSIARTKVSA